MATTIQKSTIKGVKKATWSEVMLYGFGGGLGSNIPFTFVLMFAPAFFTGVLKISPLSVGVLLLVPRLVDAFTDPVMGMVADRTNTKWGRYRPYMIFGAPLLGISLILMFTNFGLEPSKALVMAYAIYIFYSLASTVANIPYHSTTAILSNDPHQRTIIASAKQIFGRLIAIPIVMVTPIILAKSANPAAAYSKIAIVLGIALTLTFWICAIGSKKSDTQERWIRQNKTQNKVTIKEQLSLIVKNKALIMLILAFATDMIAFSASSGVALYYFKFCIGKPAMMGPIQGIGLVIALPAMFLVPWLSKKVGKKNLYMISSALLFLLSAWLFFIPFTNITLIFVQATLTSILAAFTAVLVWGMLADCVEYGEWVTGISGAGTVTSQATFINKLGSSLGGFLLGVILAAGGFVAGAATQSHDAQIAIVSIKSFLPAFGSLCSVIAMFFYPITNDLFSRMVKENKERREKKDLTSAEEITA